MSNGKGSTPRPIQVSYQTYAKNWQKAFGENKPKAIVKKKKG